LFLVFSALTLLLLLMVVCWGANYAVVKMVVQELPPSAFNVVRLLVASSVFLTLMGTSTWLRRGAPALRSAIADRAPGGERSLAFLRTASRPTGRDWLLLAGLGLVGQFLYQVLFADGVAKTSVANAALIIGCTPIAVSMASAALRLDRLGPSHWIGIALSALGMYLVVGLGARLSSASIVGDVMMLGCVLCWTVYTLAGQPLLRRHSPLLVTGWSMAFGTLLYVPYSLPAVRTVNWAAVRPAIWVWTVLSALLALNVSYVIWYAAVQRLGSARTSIYSNLVPVAALVAAAVWLGEPIGQTKLAGALLVIGGLLTTRIRRPVMAPPAEE
jgi:drug/metabolite transporter (DMT)-like permease